MTGVNALTGFNLIATISIQVYHKLLKIVSMPSRALTSLLPKAEKGATMKAQDCVNALTGFNLIATSTLVFLTISISCVNALTGFNLIATGVT